MPPVLRSWAARGIKVCEWDPWCLTQPSTFSVLFCRVGSSSSLHVSYLSPTLKRGASESSCPWMKATSSVIVENFQDVHPPVWVLNMFRSLKVPSLSFCLSSLVFKTVVLLKKNSTWMLETGFSLPLDITVLILSQPTPRENGWLNSGWRTGRRPFPRKCKEH